MQDKEFDDLFRSKLDDFEMEPSAKVWTNIDTKLDGKERKKSTFPVLRIAASIIILVTAGILFIPKKENSGPVKPGKNRLVNNQAAQAVVKPIAHTPANTDVVKDSRPANTVIANRVAVVQHHAEGVGAPVKSAGQTAHAIDNTEPVKTEEQQMLAAVSTKPVEITNPVVPDIATPLSIKQADLDETATIKPVLTAQNPAAKPANTVVRKRGIHNFGDLVNLVVAKVDKRKDKVIEFTDTDDDESTITAVNVGPIKIKKEK
ncbi:MAG: hypothetical protein JWP37_829 [Mucilaginibacter sp.]|nr:hypothetical protein [Mucilaginibacter sp.]